MYEQKKQELTSSLKKHIQFGLIVKLRVLCLYRFLQKRERVKLVKWNEKKITMENYQCPRAFTTFMTNKQNYDQNQSEQKLSLILFLGGNLYYKLQVKTSVSSTHKQSTSEGLLLLCCTQHCSLDKAQILLNLKLL